MKIDGFNLKKENEEKISVVTCYDYAFARIINQTDIDCILVGDSGSMVVKGLPSTVHATVEMMSEMISAVSNGAPKKFIIGDMPFASYRKGLKSTMDCVDSFMKAGAHSVKLEGASGNLDTIKHIVESGVPVMGHLGLTPQSVNLMGGYKVQGRDDLAAAKLIEESKKLEDSGCFSLVLECVPALLAEEVSKSLKIPTIGIGAGAGTDGQVLVLHDMLGMNSETNMRFLRKYADLESVIYNAVNQYNSDVKELKFPNSGESF